MAKARTDFEAFKKRHASKSKHGGKHVKKHAKHGKKPHDVNKELRTAIHAHHADLSDASDDE